MLVAIRLFLAATGLVVLALAVTARGLVPEPDVRTRIGEVPSVGRSLVQQAIVPPATIERQSSGLDGDRAEAPADAAGALAPAHSASVDKPSSGSEAAAAAAPREADLAAVHLTETPSPAKPSDIADGRWDGAGPDRAAAAGQAALSDSFGEVRRNARAFAGRRAGRSRIHLRAGREARRGGGARFGRTARARLCRRARGRTQAPCRRPGAAPEKAKPDEAAAPAGGPAAAIGPDSDPASEAAQTRSSKSANKSTAAKRKVARSSARKAAAKSERKDADKPRGKIKVARRASRRPGRPAIEQWTTPDGFSATPQTYQYRYTAPAGENAAPADTTSVQ